MNTEQINLEIEGKEFECEVSFNFTKGTPGVYHLAPEDCYPSEPDEYEIIELVIFAGELSTCNKHDISFLIEDLTESIEEQLEEIRNE